MKSKTEKVLNLIFGSIGIIWLGLSCWFTFADIWIALPINDFQSWLLDGSYYPILTIGLVAFVVLIPLVAIKFLIVFVLNKNLAPENKIPYFRFDFETPKKPTPKNEPPKGFGS